MRLAAELPSIPIWGAKPLQSPLFEADFRGIVHDANYPLTTMNWFCQDWGDLGCGDVLRFQVVLV